MKNNHINQSGDLHMIDISEKEILSLLGKIHIDGKTAWKKHELAYFLREDKRQNGRLEEKGRINWYCKG